MSKKLDNETVDAKLEGRGIKRIGEYVGSATKILWGCEICGNRWCAIPNSVLNNESGCPKCGRENRKKLIYGHGINNLEESIYDKNGKMFHFYTTWRAMLKRCYDKKFHEKHPTYMGSEVAPEWWYLSNFKEWYDLQGDIEGCQLDKDLLSDSKLYSPDSCVFIPASLNSLFNDHGNSRGDYPTGVYLHGKNFRAQINRFGERKKLGTYLTIEEAELAYLYAKIAYVNEVIYRLSHEDFALNDPQRFEKVYRGVQRILDSRYRSRVDELLHQSLSLESCQKK